MSTHNICPTLIRRPPSTADFLGSRYLIIMPGMIPYKAAALRMKSNQSKIASSILYFSLMKSKYLKTKIRFTKCSHKKWSELNVKFIIPKKAIT